MVSVPRVQEGLPLVVPFMGPERVVTMGATDFALLLRPAEHGVRPDQFSPTVAEAVGAAMARPPHNHALIIRAFACAAAARVRRGALIAVLERGVLESTPGCARACAVQRCLCVAERGCAAMLTPNLMCSAWRGDVKVGLLLCCAHGGV